MPLREAATAKVGPESSGNVIAESVCQYGENTPQDSETATQDKGETTQVTTQDIFFSQGTTDKLEVLIDFCSEARSKKELMAYMGLLNSNYFRKKYLKPLLENDKIRMTIPDKPNSRNQKYIKT